jgi:serine/threonine protein kinase
MGVVYRGYDPNIRRPVAIKTIAKDLFDVQLNPEDVAARFRREAQAAGNLNHHGIVSVYEYGETDEYAFIAMECVEGTSLREYFAQKTQFPECDVVSIMAQLLDALDYAHEHEVVHRDVKPANIIIMRNGRIKLADFGIARLEASDRTQTGLIMGTPGYIAPEYYFAMPIDHRVDIFAAGVVLYELLCGESPFRGSPEAVMRAVCYEDAAPPSTVGLRRPLGQYDAIVARALQRKVEDRFPSAASFRQAVLAEYRHVLPDSITSTIVLSESDPAAPPAPPLTPPPTGWDAAVLARVRGELTQILGPIAKIMVQRAAQQHKNLRSLVLALAQQIPSPVDREAFQRETLGPEVSLPPATLRTARTSRSGAPMNGAPVSDPGMMPVVTRTRERPATEQDVAELVRTLTTHIGPVARVIVKRVQTDGLSRSDLFMKAAQAIDSEAIRDRFIKESGLHR